MVVIEPAINRIKEAARENENNWVFGLLASMIVGSVLGLSLLQAGFGSVAWGVAAGALTFACFRPWPSVANTSISTDPSPSPDRFAQ